MSRRFGGQGRWLWPLRRLIVFREKRGIRMRHERMVA